MAQLDRLKDRAKALEAKDPRAAVDAWLEVLKLEDSEGEPNPDLGLFNRIGDLYIKLRDPAQAADYYDRAVDKYAELGFHNNAIAMCNKVLRNAPARQGTYLKLARLYAAKGFLAEAKQNFVEYAERMQKAGKIEQAFGALKHFTDLSPESEGLRRMLEEHLKVYGDVARRPSAAAPRPGPAAEPDVKSSGKRKTSSLVFLDLDEPTKPKAPVKPNPPVAAKPAPPPAPAAEPDTGIEIERTSLSADAPPGRAEGLLQGFETTSADFDDTRAATPPPPSLRDDPVADDVEPALGFEPTISDVTAHDIPPLIDTELTVPDDPPAPPPPPRPVVKPVIAKSAPAKAPPPEPPKRRTQVEVPPLELEPDFASSTHSGHDLDDQPLATSDDTDTSWVETEDDSAIGGRSSGFIDLGVDGIVNQGEGALSFAGIDDIPAAPSIEALEARVADDPDDAEAHQALGEALIETGERERGIEELDIATNGFESAGNLQRAQDLVDEILRLDPNSVRHRQKVVEFAYKASDKSKLIGAYLELADTLLRADLADKAHAVYKRVAEHDPGNPRVKAALAMFAPPPAAPAAKEGRVAAKDAKMTVRDSTVDTGDFIDLGSLVLDDDHDRDTRMKVQDEEPTGDEERDFQDMLARFKQGIDENIDEADFQSHYDLGVAFKEMGLLDEAISEFQKSLRGPKNRVRAIEALGQCFVEKVQLPVAATILQRALAEPGVTDDSLIGVLYLLGTISEELDLLPDAKMFYERVFAVDIQFRDIGDRLNAVEKRLK